MDELVYFTNRSLSPSGNVRAWVYRQDCPKCKKAKMGKPLKPDGKPKIRADEYECPSCKYNIQKQAYEDTLTLEAKYTCPACKNPGEGSAPFKWKKVEGISTVRLKCQNCSANIDITKKMKQKEEPDNEK